MGQRDKDTSNEVNLLLNLCKHHEQTIANMFAIQEPVMRYARAMMFIQEYPEEVKWLDSPPDINEVEDCITDWENHYGRTYKVDWDEA